MRVASETRASSNHYTLLQVRTVQLAEIHETTSSLFGRSESKTQRHCSRHVETTKAASESFPNPHQTKPRRRRVRHRSEYPRGKILTRKSADRVSSRLTAAGYKHALVSISLRLPSVPVDVHISHQASLVCKPKLTHPDRIALGLGRSYVAPPTVLATGWSPPKSRDLRVGIRTLPQHPCFVLPTRPMGTIPMARNPEELPVVVTLSKLRCLLRERSRPQHTSHRQ